MSCLFVQVWSRMPTRWIFTVGIAGAVTWYSLRLRNANDTYGQWLEDKLKFRQLLGWPQAALVKYQVALSQYYLERTSPTVIRKELLQKRKIDGARVQDSQVLNFYRSVYKHRMGLTSSVLYQGEGKTLSCLQVLEEIEKTYKTHRRNDGAKVVFLYARVADGDSIADALRNALHILDGIPICEVLNNLSRSHNGGYVIYGLIDQFDKWYESDKHVLRTLVCQQHENLYIHAPTGDESEAQRFQRINNGEKASFIGYASPNLQHELDESQAKAYLQSLTRNPELKQAVMQYASNHNNLSPSVLAESFRFVRERGYWTTQIQELTK